MGYLDNTSITVDAILTKKGRELLAKGRSQFKITQFALADDEVDYDLWNPAHPLGSDYYGVAIENMPITEAVPDETQSMKYKLITLPKGTTAIPYIVLIGKPDVEVTAGLPKTAKSNITPETRFNGDGLQVTSLNTTLGYTATILDSTYATIEPTKFLDSGQTTNNSPMRNIAGDSETANSLSVIGLEFEVFPTSRASNLSTDKTTKVIVTANETGGRVIVPVTIKKRITTRN
jgi:hypothetical protein